MKRSFIGPHSGMESGYLPRQARVSRATRDGESPLNDPAATAARVTREFHGTYFICSPGPPAPPRYMPRE